MISSVTSNRICMLVLHIICYKAGCLLFVNIPFQFDGTSREKLCHACSILASNKVLDQVNT